MSLRTKQALILLLATVLPFALGGAAVNLVVAPAYRAVVGRASEQEARRIAEHLAWNLARDVARLEKLAAWTDVRGLARQASAAALQTGRVHDPDPGRRGLPPRARPPDPALAAAVAREFHWWQQTDPSAAEVFATDVRGRVIASSGRTPDTLQAEEDWWQQAFANGQGQAVLSGVSYDESAKVWAVSIAVPIVTDSAPGTQVVGILKAVLDVGRVFQDVTRAGMGGIDRALLADAQGRIVVSSFFARPLAQSLPKSALGRLRRQETGSLVDGKEDALLAWSAVPLDRLADVDGSRAALHVVTRRSAAEVFGPLRTVQAWMLAIGLATIAATMAFGYYLADVLVVRQIRTLAVGMRDLASGDFQHAAAVAERLLDRNGHTQRRDTAARQDRREPFSEDDAPAPAGLGGRG